ncbi:aldolase [Priestia megaterium]|uniref:aldolase n=1 Tax=Priestia megaterium TaxID=1404 RepID=UPI002E2508D8|nr:aldolase [Priestia megaterium]
MKVKLIDCTLRDGGNFNNWLFSYKDVNKLVNKLDGVGLDIIEVGYRGGSGSNKAIKVGEAANCPKDFIKGLPITKHADLSVMVVPSACPIDSLKDLDVNLVKWVRVASYPHNIRKALPYVEFLKKKGFNVGLNLMAASYSTSTQIQEIAKLGHEIGTDVFYIADSFGALTPDGVAERINAIVEVVDCPVGFHGHNNLGLAFANTIEAIKHGASYIDTSLCGMARGAGNLPTEQFTSAMNKWGKSNYNVEDCIDIADYVLNYILKSPMKISKPEIVCGLNNIHYYYYDLVESICKENNLNILEISRKLGELLPDKVDILYVNEVMDQLKGLNDRRGIHENEKIKRTIRV